MDVEVYKKTIKPYIDYDSWCAIKSMKSLESIKLTIENRKEYIKKSIREHEMQIPYCKSNMTKAKNPHLWWIKNYKTELNNLKKINTILF